MTLYETTQSFVVVYCFYASEFVHVIIALFVLITQNYYKAIWWIKFSTQSFIDALNLMLEYLYSLAAMVT